MEPHTKRIAAVVAAVQSGLTRRQACAHARVPWSTMQSWLAKGRAELASAASWDTIGEHARAVLALDFAESELAAECVKVLRDVVRGEGPREPSEHAPDAAWSGFYQALGKWEDLRVKTAQWLLERRHPLQWGRVVTRPDMIVTVGDDGKPRVVRIDDLTGEDPAV